MGLLSSFASAKVSQLSSEAIQLFDEKLSWSTEKMKAPFCRVATICNLLEFGKSPDLGDI